MRLIGVDEETVRIEAGGVILEGALGVPSNARGLVLFAHGSGSSRHSPRNNFVAKTLRNAGLATLLFDLLTRDEDLDYDTRFDITLLTERLVSATRWALDEDSVKGLPLGYFGASTGAAAAINASVIMGPVVGAVVSRGGRPDMSADYLSRVAAPTLLIVGGADGVVVDLNKAAAARIKAEKEVAIVPGATHLFEETGALEEVSKLATAWFLKHLGAKAKAGVEK
ncbi:MAG: dienelactone hydrolase family protein [Deltaproteobacteria bacterium]|nr:dienelactone hydrolase family protein [Deltaproteobacteria bacterium]